MSRSTVFKTWYGGLLESGLNLTTLLRFASFTAVLFKRLSALPAPGITGKDGSLLSSPAFFCVLFPPLGPWAAVCCAGRGAGAGPACHTYSVPCFSASPRPSSGLRASEAAGAVPQAFKSSSPLGQGCALTHNCSADCSRMHTVGPLSCCPCDRLARHSISLNLRIRICKVRIYQPLEGSSCSRKRELAENSNLSLGIASPSPSHTAWRMEINSVALFSPLQMHL